MKRHSWKYDFEDDIPVGYGWWWCKAMEPRSLTLWYEQDEHAIRALRFIHKFPITGNLWRLWNTLQMILITEKKMRQWPVQSRRNRTYHRPWCLSRMQREHVPKQGRRLHFPCQQQELHLPDMRQQWLTELLYVWLGLPWVWFILFGERDKRGTVTLPPRFWRRSMPSYPGTAPDLDVGLDCIFPLSSASSLPGGEAETQHLKSWRHSKFAPS